MVCVELFSHPTCGVCEITCCDLYGIIVWYYLWCVWHYCVILPVVCVGHYCVIFPVVCVELFFHLTCGIYDITCGGIYGIILRSYLWCVWHFCVNFPVVCVELFSYLTCDVCDITCCGLYGIIV